MSKRMKVNPLKFLVFLLPALIPLPFILTHAHYVLYLLSWLLCVFVTAVYPIISALVFVESNIFIWSAPAVYTVMTTFVTLWIYVWSGGPAGDQFLFILPLICLSAIGWSVMCTMIVLSVTRKKEAPR